MAVILIVGDDCVGISEAIARLRESGHEVIEEPELRLHKRPEVIGIADTLTPIQLGICKVAERDFFDFRRQRDYPTLKQGLRTPRIRRTKK